MSRLDLTIDGWVIDHWWRADQIVRSMLSSLHFRRWKKNFQSNRWAGGMFDLTFTDSKLPKIDCLISWFCYSGNWKGGVDDALFSTVLI